MQGSSPALVMLSPTRHFEPRAAVGKGSPVTQRGLRTFKRLLLAGALAGFCALGSAWAQQEHKHKPPVIEKITSGGTGQQAFSGTVQSLDLHHSLLNVNTVQGGNTEIFPLRKGIHVATASGAKLKLAQLAPGTNVLIYYEQKGDRRTVKEIVVLQATPPSQGAKKPSPPPS